jgi:hypothetical protein
VCGKHGPEPPPWHPFPLGNRSNPMGMFKRLLGVACCGAPASTAPRDATTITTPPAPKARDHARREPGIFDTLSASTAMPSTATLPTPTPRASSEIANCAFYLELLNLHSVEEEPSVGDAHSMFGDAVHDQEVRAGENLAKIWRKSPKPMLFLARRLSSHTHCNKQTSARG